MFPAIKKVLIEKRFVCEVFWEASKLLLFSFTRRLYIDEIMRVINNVDLHNQLEIRNVDN